MTKAQRKQKAALIMALDPRFPRSFGRDYWEFLASAFTAARAVLAGKPVHDFDKWVLDAIK